MESLLLDGNCKLGRPPLPETQKFSWLLDSETQIFRDTQIQRHKYSETQSFRNTTFQKHKILIYKISETENFKM